MHILCTICSDLVNQAESLYVTKCGHIFHHQCLAQWIERSKSCPQCRNKVTERCMFRMYPTVSNEASGEDAATLQSRLDDAMLQLRTQRANTKELEERLAAATADLNKKDELLKAAERRLVARESAAAALRDQLAHAREQGRDTQRLREENQQLQKNMQTLNGLQRVLNATADEVEAMLQDYSDLRTVATFAAALKRALCDSEVKKRSCRARQLAAAQELEASRARQHALQAALSEAQNKVSELERSCEALRLKRRGDADGTRAAKLPRAAGVPAPGPAGPAADSPPPADSFRDQRLNDAIVSEDNLSFGSMVARIQSAESPYLPLRRSGLALAALRRTSSLPDKSGGRSTSIFQPRAPAPPAPAPASAPAPAPARAPAPADVCYDGLGGRARPDVFPAPRLAPRPGARHRLKRFDPATNQDITKMFGKLPK